MNPKTKYLFDADLAIAVLGGTPSDHEIQRLVLKYPTYNLPHRKHLISSITDGKSPVFMAKKKLEALGQTEMCPQQLGPNVKWATAKIRRFVRRMYYLRYRIDQGMTRRQANQRILYKLELRSTRTPNSVESRQRTVRRDTQGAAIDLPT